VGETENVELIRRGYNAFSAGDIEGCAALFAEDAVWHVPGTGPLAGSKKGREAIAEFFMELGQRSAGTAHVEVLEMFSAGDRVVVLDHFHAEHDGRSLDQDGLNLFTVHHGQVAEVRQFYEDTTVEAAFWS
jgi:uncharacterized protein (TIGR02246 family)